MTLLNEALEVKERDQVCTQERLREMEERIMECQKLIGALGVEKVGLSETVAEKDRIIGEGVERVSV